MKVCGIELKGNEARIIALEGHPENFDLLNINLDKLKLKDPKSQDEIKAFRETMLELFSWQDFDLIGIKERISKGRFAGGAISFKMEALIQTADHDIRLVHTMSIKSKIKDLDIPFDGIKKYQEEAYKVAVYLLNLNK